MKVNLEHYLGLIKLVPIDKNNFQARWASNNKDLGEFIQEVDGFYVHYPNTDLRGCTTETYALAIGANLMSLNEDWREELASV